jgi:hypothetical protein
MYCKHCNQTLPQESFYFDRTNNRYKKTCKSCTAVRRALRRDKYNRRRRQYYEENKEKLAAEARKYYTDNQSYRDKRLKQFKDYYISNKQGRFFSSEAAEKCPVLPAESFDPESYSKILDRPTKSQ